MLLRRPTLHLKRNRGLEAMLRAQLDGLGYHDVEWVYENTLKMWGDVGRAALGRVDRYYLLTNLLHRTDACHPWLFARCREVENDPDGYLDLWAREHYKSTIITFAGAIQELLNDPEITIGIFSHTKPTAKKFFTQIKNELETNDELKRVYSDVLWADPKKEAPRWSDEKGIAVKRKSNPKEATVEAHGLVDGQPTGAHFKLRIYDDVVTLESVTSPEMVAKTTYAHDISDNLGARGENGRKRAWRVGTRYKYGDTYGVLIERGAIRTRIYPATKDGTPTGEPVFLSEEALKEIRDSQPSAIFAAQQLMNPAAGLEAMFQKAWLRFIDIRPATLNVYIVCDPASSHKKASDRTAIMAIGIDAGRNKYLLGGFLHKMGLAERWQRIRDLYRHWTAMPGVQSVQVGYERFGMRDALEYFEERMLVEGLSFPIEELAWPSEGGNAKYDRIQRLEPDFRNGRWYLAAVPTRKDEDGREVPVEETTRQRQVREAGESYRIFKPARHRDDAGNAYSLNARLLDEYLVYPYVTHDDGLDCLSRIYDMDPQPPVLVDQTALEPEVFVDGM